MPLLPYARVTYDPASEAFGEVVDPDTGAALARKPAGRLFTSDDIAALAARFAADRREAKP